MTYFNQLPPEKLRQLQLKSRDIRQEKYKLKINKAVEIWHKTHNIHDISKEFNCTKDNAYKMLRKAERI
jgi:hypothetical protein